MATGMVSGTSLTLTFGPLDFASVLVESALETLVADDTVADVDGSAGVDAPGSEDAAGL